MTKKIGIIDYDAGNIFSITTALENITKSVIISNTPDKLDCADSLILPGVGSFKSCLKNLRSTKMDEFIIDYASKGKPILGICLGMQVLLNEGWEDGREEGIGLIDGSVKRIYVKKEVRLPHMGWNDVYGNEINKFKLFNGIRSNSDFYFVHSYEAILVESINALYTNYGDKKIIAAYQKNNRFGVQFHPEKSQKIGIKLLTNFVSL